MVVRGWERREWGKCCLMGAEFQFYKMKRAVEMDGGDGAQDYEGIYHH